MSRELLLVLPEDVEIVRLRPGAEDELRQTQWWKLGVLPMLHLDPAVRGIVVDATLLRPEVAELVQTEARYNGVVPVVLLEERK